MNFRIKKSVVAVSVALAALTGCAEISKHERVNREAAQANDAKISSIKAAQSQKNEQLVHAPVSHTQTSWVGSRYVVSEIKQDGGLPAALDREITIKEASAINSIENVAERIVRASGIPVRVMPDALAGGATGGSSSIPPTPDPAAQQVALINGVPVSASGSATSIPETGLDYSGRLSSVLDRVCAKFGLSWKYQDKQVYIYRYVTREFSLASLPGITKFNTSIGKTAGSAGGETSSFSSNSLVDSTSELDFWKNIGAAIGQMLSVNGKYTLNQATGTLVVTDVKEVIDRVAKFVEHENAIMTRQVEIKVEVYNVTLDNNKEYGIDWNLVYSKLTNLVPDWTINFSSPATLTGTAAGGLGVSIVSPVDTNGLTDSLNGSSALVQALASIGTVSAVTSVNAVTMNRQPVPVAVTTQTGYLAATTPASTTDGGTGGVPGLTPGTVTTGFIFNLLPVVTADNRIMLRFSMDLSELKRIGIVSVGSGATLQSIQTPEVASSQLMQGASLAPGETLVLSGFERVNNGSEKALLSEAAPIGAGGSYKGTQTRQTTVVMLTPYLSGKRGR